MIPAEGADRIDNLIDFLQRLAVHEPVEFLKVGFDGCVVHAGGVVIGIVQQVQEVLVG